MPVLPTYNSQRNINANPAEPFRNEAAQPYQDQQKVLGTLQEITQKWSDANDVMQYTDAKARYEQSAVDIQTRAAADPDFKNSEKYYKELDKAKRDSLSVIKNQRVAGQASREFDHNNFLTGLKIDQNFKGKQLDYNKVQVGTNLDILQQKKLSAATPAEAMQYDEQIKLLLNNNVSAQVLSYADADKMLKASQVTGVKYEIYSDPSTQEKSSQVLKELQKPNGKYSFLPPDDRLKLVEESQRRIFQNNQTYKRQDELMKNDRFNNIFQKANEGTLTLNDLDAEQAAAKAGVIGSLEQKEILDIRKAIQSRTKTALESIVDSSSKAENYLDFFDNFIDNDTDRQKGREAIVEAFKDGILSPKEASFLNSIKRETEDVQWSRTKEGMSSNNMIPFKNAIFAVKEWFRGTGRHDEKDAAMAIKKLLSGLSSGENQNEVVEQIFNDDRVEQQPDIKAYPSTGQLMIDPVSGVKALVYPDGKIEIQK